MKVLSFSYCFPHAGQPTWGIFVEQRLAALARRTDLKAVSPRAYFPLLTRRQGDCLPEQEVWRGLAVYRPSFFYIPGILKSSDGWFYARGLRKWLAEFCRMWKPDVLDAHFVWPDGVGVSLLARELKIPYAITLRGKIYPCLEVPSQKRQCADALQHAAVVISVSSPMAEEARKLGAAADRIHVIPNGVNREMFYPMEKSACRKALGLEQGGRLIVTMAHLGPRKGHREVIKALSQLPEDVRLVIVGGDMEGGKNERSLRELISSLRLEKRVLLTGSQPYEKIPLYCNAADAGVLASYREGCPNAVLESLACGRPVVATRVGAVPDLIVNEEAGRIVPVRDIPALAGAIADVLSVLPSSEAVSGSPSVKSWDEAAEDVYEIFQKI